MKCIAGCEGTRFAIGALEELPGGRSPVPSDRDAERAVYPGGPGLFFSVLRPLLVSAYTRVISRSRRERGSVSYSTRRCCPKNRR